MQLVDVNTDFTRQEFLEMPLWIYENNQYWVRPWNHDIENVFNPEKNKLLKDGGETMRWILKDDTDKRVIGRVAVFINPKTKKTSEYISGGMGFFECINNQSAANLLFDACKNWLAERGCECMDGPINFGERDAWWGCLREGFEDSPTYQMNYNPEYYNALFENYGFQTYFNQLVYNYPIATPIPQKFYDKAERITRDGNYRFIRINKKEIKKFAADFATVYNEAWSKMQHFKPIRNEFALHALNTMKPIMDKDLVWFGYHGERPVSFFCMVPEINQIIRFLNGKFGLMEKIKFFYFLKLTNRINKAYGIVFGVVADHQGKGVEAAMVIAAAKIVQPLKKYQNLEMNWIGDFNPKMIRVIENLDTTIVKKYITYRYLFDRTKEFKRYPIVG
jgi:hypothetical protein